MVKRKAAKSKNVKIKAGTSFEVNIPIQRAANLIAEIGDLFRPVKAYSNLISAKIELCQMETRRKTLQKTKEILELADTIGERFSPKTTYNIVSKLSLEDPDDDFMIEAWANLLASHLIKPDDTQLYFAKLLSEINKSQEMFLEDLAVGKYSRCNIDPEHAHIFNGIESDITPSIMDDYAKTLTENGEKKREVLIAALAGPGIKFSSSVSTNNFHWNKEVNRRQLFVDDEHILHYLSLINIYDYFWSELRPDVHPNFVSNYTISYTQISQLGLALLRVCSPKVQNMLKERHSKQAPFELVLEDENGEDLEVIFSNMTPT